MMQPCDPAFSARRLSRHIFLVLASLLLVSTLQAAQPPQPPPLAFNRDRGEMDARIDGWPLRRLLDRMVVLTGWQIYLEPGTDHRISSSFRGLETREALSRLLGDLSFALISHTNTNSKLFIYRSSVQEATQLIPNPDATDPSAPADASHLSDELIVTLKPGSKQSIDELASSLGAKIIGRADDLNAYRLKFDDEAAAREARQALASNPEVASVDDNYRINRPPTSEALQLVGPPVFNLKPTARADGSYFIVGLVDTAVQAQGTGLKDFLLNAIALSGDYTPGISEPTHGTSMAETILRGLTAGNNDGSTPVRLLPVDVYGPNENTTSFDVARGIYAAVKGGATVVNLSMGSSGDSGFLRTLIAEGEKQGVLFIAAAGNQPTTLPTFPAAYPQVLAVTAGDRHGNIASYANRGAFVDAVAPGGGLIQFRGQSYFGVGTSYSSAFVSGAAAGLSADGVRTPEQVRQQLIQNLGRKPAP